MPAALRFDTAASVAQWYPINDAVMGGHSSARLRWSEPVHAMFEGFVSLENGGGFASIRAKTSALAAAGIAGYRINVWGDGKRYKLNLRTDDAFDGVSVRTDAEVSHRAYDFVSHPDLARDRTHPRDFVKSDGSLRRRHDDRNWLSFTTAATYLSVRSARSGSSRFHKPDTATDSRSIN